MSDDIATLLDAQTDSIIRGPARTGGLCPLFATPTLRHAVVLDFFLSYLYTSDLLREAGISHSFISVGGDPFVAKARNHLVYDFLHDHPNASHLFFLDDDIGWPGEAVLRLLRSGHDITAGVYPQRLATPSFACELDFSGEQLYADGNFLRANLVPGGFLCIARHVLERLAAESPTYEEVDAAGRVRQCPEVFRAGLGEAGKWWTEDYIFAQRARAAGFTIWVDPDIEFSHNGRHRFQGNLAVVVQDWIRNNFVPRAEAAE